MGCGCIPPVQLGCGCSQVVFVFASLFALDFCCLCFCAFPLGDRGMDSETDMSDGEINQAGLSSLELWRMLPRLVQTAFGSGGALLSDDAIMAYLFDTEEELVSLLQSILGPGAEGLLQAHQIMLEL